MNCIQKKYDGDIMSDETGKCVLRRFHDHRFATRYFVGNGIDIGSGEDSLDKYKEFFPMINSIRSWDLPDGDAQFMESAKDETYDFVHSSHCLEHLYDPFVGLKNWIRVTKTNGHLVIVIPDEDLYEQGVFPSTFNGDHKCTFTIHKKESWNKDSSINVFDLLSAQKNIKICKIELLDATFRYGRERFDQTFHSFGDCAIEIILQKV